ncbi:37S ribosomal protein, mitochondrial [Gonapodya sp. JEL0774]|nr:37S ribosomal protein, mitochondrial [Gonapodya sp. JEL0774]
MLPYIYGTRHGIHIINLERTLAMLRRATAVAREVALNGGIVVFVAGRPWTHRIAVDAARSSGSYFITDWKPGTIANRDRVLKRSVASVAAGGDGAEFGGGARAGGGPGAGGASDPELSLDIDVDLSSGAAGASPSPPPDSLSPSSKPPSSPSSPTTHSPHVPSLLILLDLPSLLPCAAESSTHLIPTISLVDSDCDPRRVTYPIPGNDDNVAAVELFAGVLARAVREGVEVRCQAVLEASSGKRDVMVGRGGGAGAVGARTERSGRSGAGMGQRRA